MGKGNQMEGGFALLNDSKGRIENCYAAVKMKNKRENAGFVYNNKGTVFHCFTRSSTQRWKHSSKENKRLRDGFFSFNSGIISGSFFLAKKKSRLKKYRDEAFGFMTKDADYKMLGALFDWDFSVFEEKSISRMDFLSDNWYYTIPENKEKERIRTEKELVDIIDRINRGDKEAVCGWYELDADLNFRGRALTPIGCNKAQPFEGVFDGKGHIIRDFVLKGKDRPVLGFFGYLKGTAANLRIDGIAKGQNCAMTASFCAVNDGEIHCCEALFEMHSKYNLGMFVGENHGLIERCSISGKSRGAFFFVPLPLFPLLLFAAMTAAIVIPHPIEPPQDYKAVLQDKAIIPNDESETFVQSNKNKASYEVPKTIRVDADTLTASDDQYIIKNPDRGANYDFVAVIYMINRLGEEVEVYRSGRIPVGYHINALTLTPPEGITLSKGSYDAQIVFSFYNQDTGEKGMMDSSVSITIQIQ